ncbi:Spo0J Stage 0 sporulation protein J (antagonist of Soj) containing ParB-like nuclease domain [uncultured Caudovirales phage]|uniref:Spo0J Stage 0 sporulation protein J (Antagonist of Soj) containing ParB-like nuclease domain n=1 Tax=uncultured Caudovirales phage TaxID=2100421 RepID=A0A6J5M1R2_9CAUD|nr:Spo0J Stage 0 sporulation protein J (antagonist of Soj) containing ParB-like nuclease domain [uncultured Caudovirales phage]
MSKMKIEYKPTADLIPYARNSRTHTDAQVNQIASSIREFGFRVPVLVSGDNTIIAGHGRVLAALKLGIEEIPTVDGSDMDDIQRRMYVIADNKIALNAGWDEEVLMLEIEDLRSLGADIELLAFDPSEIKRADIDYSVLDDHNIDDQIDDMAKGVRKAIQVEFEVEHYDEAFELIKYWRDEGAYVGYMIMDFLRKEKAKVQ